MPRRYTDEELCALKSDRKHHDRITQAVQETERLYRDHPGFASLNRALTAASTSSDILAAVRHHMHVEQLRTLIRHELGNYRNVPFYNSSASAIDQGAITGWTVYSHEKVLVTLIVIDATAFNATMDHQGYPPTIRFAASDMSLTMLAGSTLRLDRYKAKPILDDTLVHAGLRCEPDGETLLKKGETITCRGGADALVYRYANTSTVLLQISSRKKTGSVMADYNSKSFALRKVVAADQRINRLQVVTSLARLFAHPEAASALQGLTDHPDHYVRWQAARELTALSPVDALPALTRMAARDRNPGVRNNAAQTIGYLSERGIRAA